MSITLWAIIVVLFGHWMFDFLLQPHWMGMRKSKEWSVLFEHACRITSGCIVVGGIILGANKGWHTSVWPAYAFAGINGVAHFAIDAVTSRITSKAFAAGKIHKFFTVIGFDQFLHYTCAFGTVVWLLN